jgi:hypothetical protein
LAEGARESPVKMVRRKTSLARDFREAGIGAGVGVQVFLSALHPPEQLRAGRRPARGHPGGALPHFDIERQQIASQQKKLLV